MHADAHDRIGVIMKARMQAVRRTIRAAAGSAAGPGRLGGCSPSAERRGHEA